MKNIIDLENNELKPFPKVGRDGFTTYIDNELYYVKTGVRVNVELIIYEFCKLLGIPCVEYKKATKWNLPWVISKSYKKDGFKYISGKELIEDFLNNTDNETLKELNLYNINKEKYNNLETIWLSLADKYKENPSKYNDIRNVMVEILKQYFLMIMIQDADYYWLNWEIEESKDHIALAPKYDNEGAFAGEYYGVSMGVDANDPFKTTIESIEYFTSITAKEDNDIFLTLFNKATPQLFQEAIDKVKEKYGLDRLEDEEQFIKRYQDQYHKIEDLLKEKGLRR